MRRAGSSLIRLRRSRDACACRFAGVSEAVRKLGSVFIVRQTARSGKVRDEAVRIAARPYSGRFRRECAWRPLSSSGRMLQCHEQLRADAQILPARFAGYRPGAHEKADVAAWSERLDNLVRRGAQKLLGLKPLPSRGDLVVSAGQASGISDLAFDRNQCGPGELVLVSARQETVP